jgi:hypothetical protein
MEAPLCLFRMLAQQAISILPPSVFILPPSLAVASAIGME